jgi:hypothetical protein
MNKAVEFELDKNGILLRPAIHDGHLVGINLPDKGIAHLTMQNLSGQRFVLEMAGVERLVCNGFAEGNIILDVQIISGYAPTKEALQSLMDDLHPNVKEPYISQHEAWISRTKQNIIDGKSIFLEVAPSYGCEVFGICAAVRFWEN